MMFGRRFTSLGALILATGLLALGAAGARAQRQDAIGVQPVDGQRDVWLGTPIVLSFDRAVDQASVEQAFSVDPSLPGAFRWQSWDQRSYVEFRPKEPMAAQTRYNAVLGTGAKDAQGRALVSQALKWSFTTGSAQGQLRFGYGPTVQLLAPSGSHGLGLQADYPRFTADFALYAVDLPGFVQRYGRLSEEDLTIDVKGLAQAAAWKAWVDNSEGMKGVGLPKGTPAGLYVAEASHPTMGQARVLLIYSDLAIVAKRGRKGLTAWTSHVRSSQPQAGIRTSMVDAGGQELTSVQADSDGIARFDAGQGKPAFLVAANASETTLVGLDARWSSDYWWWRGPWMEDGIWPGGGDGGAATVTGHLHSDRPIYKPGDTLHFKGSFRRFGGQDGALQALEPTTPISVTFRDARSNLISTQSLRPDAFGSVHGSLALGDEVATGNWQMEAHVLGRTLTLSIKVEAYVKPDYEVQVLPARAWAVSGEKLDLTVTAGYYYGQPVSGAEAVLRVYRGWWWPGSGNQPVQTFTGTLDDQGRWALSLPMDAVGSYGENFSFEAEVTDASRRPVTASASVMVHPAAFTLTMEAERYGIEKGETARFTLRTLDHDGRPVAGRKVSVSRKVYEQAGERVVDTQTLTTDAGGQALLEVPGLGSGWYSFEAKSMDDAGRPVGAWSYAWVWEGGRPWYWWGGLELSADQASYAPGDKAKILIKSPVATTALVTVERDEVYAEFVLPVSGATPVEIPIEVAYAPNVRVRVHLWQPGGANGFGKEGELLSAQLDLTVPAEDRRLKVEVLPAVAKAGPGQQTELRVKVTDAAGAPVRAQVSLALVDKAVLALAKDPSGPIFDAFWKDWPHAVGTFDSTRPGYTAERGRDEAGGGGPGGTPAPSRPGADKSADEQPSVAPRKDFRDTAYWNPVLETGADGVATVSLKLPENLTTWVAVARAIDLGARAGEGKAELLVSKDLSVDLALPRFAVQGDSFVVDALARNDLREGSLPATLSLTAPGLVALDPGERQVDLPKGQLKAGRWSVVASKLGKEALTARLATEAGADAVELPLSIQPFSVPERFVAAGAVDSQAYETFAVPYNAIPDSSSVELRLAPSAALGVLDGMHDLIGYPYGCVEQTMSRVLPNAVIGRLAKAVQLDDPVLRNKLPGYMAAGLQRLYGFQNQDGSWGWWYGSTGNLYTTAYVLQGLLMVEAAGFDVDDAVLERGTGWLKGNINAPIALPEKPETGQEVEPRLQAYALWVLASAGHLDNDLASRLHAGRDKLDSFALASLSLALAGGGRKAEAEQALDDLLSRAKVSATTAHWPLELAQDGRWPWYYWYAMSSSDKSTAVALEALATLRPEDPLAPKAARWLLEHKQGWGWSSTQATAFSILGLTDYIVASGELDAAYSWRAELDGQVVAQGTVDRGNVAKAIAPIRLAGAGLAAGTHTLNLIKEGRGTLYYTVLGQLAVYHPSFAPAKAQGQGIQVQRSYAPIVGRSDADGWHVGDLVSVELKVTLDDDASYLIIEDKLPAGFEALNDNLATETQRPPDGRPGRDWPWWWWYRYERKELRDDKVSFFSTQLPAGEHQFQYTVRAVTPGTFSARPAEAYAMYRPEVWGRSESAQVQVAADRVAPRPILVGDQDRDCRLTDFDTRLVASDWLAGTGRDLTGDGRVSARDVATAAGRARKALACGAQVPALAQDAGEAQMSLVAAGSQGLEVTVDLRLQAAGNLGAWEALLDLPAGATFLSAYAADGLPNGMLLGTAAAGSQVRIGGWAPVGARADRPLTVARLKLRLASAGEGRLGVAAASASTDEGGAYRVQADGVDVPDLVAPLRHRVFLPRLVMER